MLIVGGSRSAPGAALLSATAALRAGAKKVQVLTVRSVAAQMAVAVPELLVEGGDETEDGELAPAAAATAQEMAKEVDVVLVGPGFMNPQAGTDLCRALVPRLQNRLVVDALALAYFSESPKLATAEGRVIVTPNVGEVALALGIPETDLRGDQHQGASRLAHRHGVVVSAGGATGAERLPATINSDPPTSVSSPRSPGNGQLRRSARSTSTASEVTSSASQRPRLPGPVPAVPPSSEPDHAVARRRPRTPRASNALARCGSA